MNTTNKVGTVNQLLQDFGRLDGCIAEAVRECSSAIAKAVVDGRRCCVTCINFEHKSELCGLVHQRPPARTIAFGCNAYLDDVPF